MRSGAVGGEPVAVRSRLPWRRVLLLLGLAVLVLLLAELAFWIVIARRVDRFDLDPAAEDGRETFVLVGSDSRAFVVTDADRRSFGDVGISPGERADLILVVQIAEDGSREAWSITRDLLVDLPDGGKTRLALTLDQGPQVLADAICMSLGIPVDHLLISDFDGLRHAVDALGGVDVDVELPIRDSMTGLDLSPGATRLDGEEALAYSRARSAETYRNGVWEPQPDGAEQRQSRATQVMTALGDAVSDRPWPWPSPAIHRLANQVAKDIRISSTLGRGDLQQLMRAMSDPDLVWRTLSVDEAQVGDVPLAEPDEVGIAELATLGSYPAPCGDVGGTAERG